jgi:hypothetical protein
MEEERWPRYNTKNGSIGMKKKDPGGMLPLNIPEPLFQTDINHRTRTMKSGWTTNGGGIGQ